MASLKRRVLSSLNLGTTLLLIGVLFIMLNWIASQRHTHWDFTRQKITALSDQTRQMLRSLKEPVTVTVFYQPDHRLYELIKDLLREYEQASPQIHVAYVDPQQDRARAIQLVQKFQIEEANVVVFESGTRHKHLSDSDLADYDFSSMQFGAAPKVKAFKGEEGFTSAIHSVTQDASPLIWVVSGHGEKALTGGDQQGLTELKKYLEQQNMTIKSETLAGKTEITAEVKLLIIAGPTHRITEQELLLLQQYLEHGGRLLALVDPLQDTGLDGLLERWGAVLGNNIVVDPSRRLPFVSPSNLLITDYTRHPIVEKMKTLMTLYPLARSVTPVSPPPQGLTVTPLALTSAEGWGEAKTSEPRFEFNAADDLKGPVSIAVAIERATPAKTRLVVVGDSDFVMDGQIANAGNRDLALGITYWLTEQESLIGISPKPIESIKLSLTAGQLSGVFWFSFLAMPLLLGAIGGAVWWNRRT